MVLFTDMLQHLQMLFIFTKRLKVSMICGSQNMNIIMRYDITLILVLALCKLRYCLIIDFLSSRKPASRHNYNFSKVLRNDYFVYE